MNPIIDKLTDITNALKKVATGVVAETIVSENGKEVYVKLSGKEVKIKVQGALTNADFEVMASKAIQTALEQQEKALAEKTKALTTMLSTTLQPFTELATNAKEILENIANPK